MIHTLTTGLLFGALHVLSGPDHLAAVAPLSLRARGAWRVGLAWGLGHALMVCALGVVVLLAGRSLPLEAWGVHSERVVGASVVLVGIWSLWRARHPSPIEAETHRHYRVPPGAHAAFWIGSLHGLAGGTHLVGLLPGVAVDHPWGYLAAFVVASVVTMSVVTGVAGPWLAREPRRAWAAKLSAWAAIAIGLAWIFTA